MAISRYSIAFIFLLSIFFSLGIALYTAQAGDRLGDHAGSDPIDTADYLLDYT